MCPGSRKRSSLSKKTLQRGSVFWFLSLVQVQARFALSALWLGENMESDSLNTSHIWLRCLSIPLSSVVPDGAVWSICILTRDGDEFYCCLVVCVLWMWCRCTGCIWIFLFTLLFQCRFVLLGHFKERTHAKSLESVKRKRIKHSGTVKSGH